MEGKQITKGLVTGLTVLAVLLGGYVGFALAMYIMGIVFGILFTVGQDLGLDNTTLDFLNNVSQNWYGFAGSLLGGATLVGTLVQIAIVIIVFGGFIYVGYKGYKRYGKSRAQDGSY